MTTAITRNALRAMARHGVKQGGKQLNKCASLSRFAPSLVSVSPSPAFSLPSRSLKTISFDDKHEEKVVERSDYPADRIKKLIGNETFAMIGYGSQGRGQALNMRDNGLKVIVGVRKGHSWEEAKKDGFEEGKSLFEIEEACSKANVIMYLLSDAAQKSEWPKVSKHVTKGKTLCFAHGFGVTYRDQTGIDVPKGVDVVLIAPKGSGTTVRNLFLQGRGINSSVAVHQDASGHAWERTYALAVALGSGYMYETTFDNETYSDLVGERGVLMGGLQGMFQAQYDVLRANGHSPSEAFNETVEEATQSLYPLIGEKGMEYMYNNCSTTARRGALDWWPKFYDANKPLFEKLYAAVKDGSETRRTLEANSRPNYRSELAKELEEMNSSEMWRAGAKVRELRPERAAAKTKEGLKK